MDSFKITLAQVAPVVLDVEKNMKRALSLLDDCGKRGSSILVLPELYLSGYEIKEAISTEAGAERLKRNVNAALPLIAEKTRESSCDILISYPLFEQPGKRPYIALEYFSGGKSLALHRKINLCNYAQYTEHLEFIEGDEVTVAEAPACKAGMFVCEDLWHLSNAIFAAKLGAEVLFYPSAATVLDRADGEKCLSNWKKLTQGTAFSQTSYVVCCNQAASPNSIYFGGSHVVDPNGEVILELPLFEECVMSADIDLSYLRSIREKRPLLKNERFDVFRKYI
jgi:predicted amidohydrolase